MARLRDFERRHTTGAKDSATLRRLGQELAALEPLVGAKRALDEVRANREKAVAALGDPELRDLALEDVRAADEAERQIAERVRELLVPQDPLDEKGVIVEIRAGEGGEEAALFARDLYRMYSRYAERHRWKTEMLSQSPSDLGGFKEVVFRIAGKRAYSRLKFESGVHRVQRVPATEAQGRIHTSTATVAVLPEAEEIDIRIPDEDLKIDVYRASGHGGQGVNTTDSAVRITHLP